MSLLDAEELVHAFVTSRLDYCNTRLSGCTNSVLKILQIEQNVATRLLKKFAHISSVLKTLQWLPVKFIIGYKILRP